MRIIPKFLWPRKKPLPSGVYPCKILDVKEIEGGRLDGDVQVTIQILDDKEKD